MTLNKKYTLYIVLGVVAGILALLLAIIAFIPKDNIDNVDDIRSANVLTTYQEAVHSLVSNGSFPKETNNFITSINQVLEPSKRLSLSGKNIISAETDGWGNPIHFICEDNAVKIFSLGEDGVKSSDDISIHIFIAYEDGGYTITSSSELFDTCLHLNKVGGNYLNAKCIESASSVTTCSGCGLLLTHVVFPVGHSVNKVDTCEEVRCDRCGVITEHSTHNFVIANPSETTLCQEGTCNTPNTYYYTCQFCDQISDLTYEYGYNEKIHDSEGIQSSRTVLGTRYLVLVCEHCDDELMSLSSEGYTGPVDDEYHSITVKSDDYVVYSTDGVDYGYINPEFKTAGTYIVYYRVEKDGRILSGSEKVIINDLPNLIFGNYQLSSPEFPHILEEAKFEIYGNIQDSQTIEVFTINNKPVTLDNDNAWYYSGELHGENIYRLEFYVRDIYGGEAFATQYFKYDVDNVLDSDLETETVVTETWHVNDTHVLLSGTVVNPNAVAEILVDDVPVEFKTGTWSVYKDILPNTSTQVIIKTKDKSGFTSIKKVSLCHSDEQPVWSIDPNKLTAYYVPITLYNPSMMPCHQIDHIIVTGSSSQPTIMNGNTLNLHAGEGYYIYHKDDTKPATLEIRLPLNALTDHIIVDVYLTHGLHMQYDIELIWIEEVYYVGIYVTETNVNTGISTTQAVYFPGYNP